MTQKLSKFNLSKPISLFGILAMIGSLFIVPYAIAQSNVQNKLKKRT